MIHLIQNWSYKLGLGHWEETKAWVDDHEEPKGIEWVWG